MPDDNAVQAKVVLQLLGRVGAYPRTDLLAALEGIAPEQITAALDGLATAGLVQLDRGGVRITEPIQYLDRLGLIAV